LTEAPRSIRGVAAIRLLVGTLRGIDLRVAFACQLSAVPARLVYPAVVL
jgi:hypothetical protein